jgi:4-hydroxy-2-oxoheptanedioate aldolase
MPARPSFRALLSREAPVIGTWAQLPHPEVVEILGGFGFDFAIVDLEHGHFGLERATDMLRACDAVGMAGVVRVRDAGQIGAVLDAGASAVVVPAIASRGDAEGAVAATRYAPSGTRGACPCVRAAGQVVGDWARHEEAEPPGAILLVETRAGLDAIEEIVAVPGAMALMLGPFDLSVSLGFRGDWRHEVVQAALSRMREAAGAAGLPVICPVFDRDPAVVAAGIATARSQGVRVFTVGTDKILLAETTRRWATLSRDAATG